MAQYFLEEFSRISDGHAYPFYPRVPLPPVAKMAWCLQGCYCRRGGQFKTLQGWSFYHLTGQQLSGSYCSGKKGAAVGIYIGRKSISTTIIWYKMGFFYQHSFTFNKVFFLYIYFISNTCVVCCNTGYQCIFIL